MDSASTGITVLLNQKSNSSDLNFIIPEDTWLDMTRIFPKINSSINSLKGFNSWKENYPEVFDKNILSIYLYEH